MSTSLLSVLKEFTRQMGDYWESTTTGAGSAGGTTLVDSLLQAKASDWVTDEAYDMLLEASGTASAYEERKVSSLSSGTLTTLAHGGQVGTGTDYMLLRLFPASDYRRALVAAARLAYPWIHKKIWDESQTAGNWLLNGDVEVWGTTSVPDNWVAGTLTAAQGTAATYYTRGTSSCKLSTAAGSLYQSNTQVPELLDLAGLSVTFQAKVYCDTASAVRLSMNDGTTTTYSSYHPGGSRWADESGNNDFTDSLDVTATISQKASAVTFSVLLGTATATAYVDDLRVYGPRRDKVYIGDLGLAKNNPRSVYQSHDADIYHEPWEELRDFSVDKSNWLHLPQATRNYRLRITGLGYLDFLASGASSTSWTATIDINPPQTDILIAQAAIYICDQMVMPNFTSGMSGRWERARAYWLGELETRRRLFGMSLPPIKMKYPSP